MPRITWVGGIPKRRNGSRYEAGDSLPPRDRRIVPADLEGSAGSQKLYWLICWHTMKRTTVKLPDDLDARLRHEAERRETTVSELTREAIEAHLGGRRSKRRLIAAGSGHSGHSDISERIEEILRAEVKR